MSHDVALLISARVLVQHGAVSGGQDTSPLTSRADRSLGGLRAGGRTALRLGARLTPGRCWSRDAEVRARRRKGIETSGIGGSGHLV